MEQKKAKLEDMLSYTPESYFTDDELALVRNTFHGVQGAKLLKVIRKVMLPTISDPELPVEMFGKDTWFSLVDFTSVLDEQAKSIAAAIQLSQKCVINGLIQLKQIAHIKEETPVNRQARREQDSAK